ncbi:MAG: response regulator transcription factor [Anaerolineae bacterium]
MKRIGILLVDDHEIVRAGLRSLLERNEQVKIVGEASSGTEAVQLATELKPDVVLMDVSMRDMDGVEATRRIKKRTPEVNVLALTVHEEEAYFFEMLTAGASGYVPKRASPQVLLTAITIVSKGEVFLHPAVAGALVQEYLQEGRSGARKRVYDGLTPRQREVLTLIAEGLSNNEIADDLGISVRTVERHRENIMKRLNLHSRVELVKYALRKGLIALSD